jgi:hypothetical protein
MSTIDFTQAVTAEAKAAAAQAALLTACQRAVDAHVEAAAKAKGYNSAAHMASYVASTVEAWAAEATAFVAWRDEVWLATIALLEDVQAGDATPPASPAEVIAILPALD